MSYSPKIFDKALREIKQRKLKAEFLAEQHTEEINQKIPEISEINRQLAGTSIELSRLILNHSGNFEQNLEKIRSCNLQGQEMIAQLLRANGYPADYMEPHYSCPMCSDSGYINGRRCDCFNALLGKYSIESLNQNSQMKLYSFDSFSLDHYPIEYNGQKCRETMTQIYNYCRNYAQSFSLNSKSIFMLGLTGVGKTHLSLSIAKEVIEKGFNVAYDSIVNYLRVIEKEHFGKADTDTLQLLLDADLLILDDLGAEFESGFYVSVIYNIINTRLNYGKPTIISSNLTPAELQKRYDDRIVSRLLAMYDYLKFTGNDIRQIKKMNGK